MLGGGDKGRWEKRRDGRRGREEREEYSRIGY